MNALVGIAKPGKFGPDVCHINLHKTFCIPHGGGGPGMGPIACKRHLEVYLPNHSVIKDCGPVTGMGAVSAAPWGSSSILSISWMYIKMMGSEGLKKASQVAIDRFCNTLKKIKEEIDKVESGEYDKVDNPIKNSPHTHVELIANKWEHKYEREEAAYPSEFLKQIKYWPPVARVDNVYGDKNLVCSCPSIDEYKDTAA